MADDYTVRDEEDFAPTYDEDEMVEVRKGDIRAVLDAAIDVDTAASGYLDDEQVEALRALARVIGLDPLVATPDHFKCKYRGCHRPEWAARYYGYRGGVWICRDCNAVDTATLGPAGESPGSPEPPPPEIKWYDRRVPGQVGFRLTGGGS